MAILINMTNRSFALRDSDLSWKASGIHAFLSRRPRGSNLNMDKLVAERRDNTKALRSGINELKNAGYLHSIQVKKHYYYLLFHQPTVIPDRQELYKTISGFRTRLGSSSSISKNTYSILLNIVTSNATLSRSKTGSGNALREKELDILVNYWLEHLKRHKKNSATFLRGEKLLVQKYDHLNSRSRLEIKTRKKGSVGYRLILGAMENYAKILASPAFPRKWPLYVGLDEFFAFSDYAVTVAFPKLRGKWAVVLDIGSWYRECGKGWEYCAKKYKVVAYHRGIVKKLAAYTGQTDLREHMLVRAAAAFYQFHEKYKARISLPDKLDEDYAARFLKYFFKFIEFSFSDRSKFGVYLLLGERFLEVDFKNYLKRAGWLR